MSRTYAALLILMVLIAAGATVYMAWLASDFMPVWMAALGPLLLIATLVTHLKGRA